MIAKQRYEEAVAEYENEKLRRPGDYRNHRAGEQDRIFCEMEQQIKAWSDEMESEVERGRVVVTMPNTLTIQ